MCEERIPFLSAEDMEFIKDILGEEVTPEVQPVETQRVKASPKLSPKISPHNSMVKTKCTSLYIGGTELPVGQTRVTADPHFCNTMFCISCDFPVLRFEDCRWDEEVPYLFLRNNYPHTVSQKLRKAKGYCAYCCQCTAKDAKETERICPFESTWVCRGH